MINGFTFVTIDADEYALNLMESESDQYPQSNLAPIIEYIKQDKKGVDKLKETLLSQDVKGTGYINAQLMQQILMRIFNMPQHEALTTVRRWDSDWGFDYNSFLSVLV